MQMHYNRKNTKLKNKAVERIAKLLFEYGTLAEFTIMLQLSGYSLDINTILTIVHFAFYEHQSLSNAALTLTVNSQNILIEAAEDNDIEFTETVVFSIMKRLMFNHQLFPKNKIAQLMTALTKKNFAAVKKAYATLQSFSKYCN